MAATLWYAPTMNKVAFITGASSGLGRSFALNLAREGYQVAIAARRIHLLSGVADQIRADGGMALVCACDVSDRDAVHEAIASAERELGPIDLLIANAGQSEMTEVDRLDAARVVELTRVNFFGVVYAVERVLPGMLDRNQGQLVAIGSLAGYGGLPKSAAYSASKGALHNFMESVRIDLRDSGVDVTLITPGYVRTDSTDKNVHPMPFVLDMDDAVDRMLRAIRARKRLYTFPRPLSSLVWVGQVFPAALYDWLASKQSREKHTLEDPQE
jgi:short-subunit dehydrogenase